MKNLILSSVCLLLLSGCSLSLFNNFRKLPEATTERTESLSWFAGDTTTLLYQSFIDFYSQHFSGLMLIKPVRPESHRVLFITELGMKIFDMELDQNGKFNLHYCIEGLNRKAAVKTLGRDIGLMLNNISDNGELKMMKEKNGTRTIIRSKDNYGLRYCFINDKTKKVEELIQTGSFLNRVKMHFYSQNEIEPDSVKISHYHLKLTIQLSKLHETRSEVPE